MTQPQRFGAGRARGRIGKGKQLDHVLPVQSKVEFIGLTFGPVLGLLAGTFAGLVQDALSSGVLGIGGLAKTIVGFAVGVVGAQFIVVSPLPRFLVFFLGASLHAGLLIGAYVLLDLRQFSPPYKMVAAQVAGHAAANALVGVVAFHLLELLPGAWQRRKAGRPIRR